MASINLSNIRDFFETLYQQTTLRLRDLYPFFPFGLSNVKQYHQSLKEENIDTANLPYNKSAYAKNIPLYAVASGFPKMPHEQDEKKSNRINNGLYYIVLADLVGSTKYLAAKGNEKAAARIINFVQAGVDAFSNIEKENQAYFLKEIGDSILFLFSNVKDVLSWQSRFNKNLSKLSPYADEAFEIRTCVHLGEVSLHDDNPLCLSVSETFKMEKLVKPGKIVFSDAAVRVATPCLLGSNYQVNAYEVNHTMTDMKEIVSEKSS
jgi:class 3 adenylate cyclase